ncbi:MAG TPA: phytanoyl-CoA dioxygenase family protein [Sphingomicrobium sp.]|nr:phytanoyl-CoA dioxygenase family protein [Sphingomicrobium sp.]
MVEAASRLTGASEQSDWHDKGWELIPAFLQADEVEQLRLEADRLWADQRLFAERGAVPNSPTRSDRLDPVIDVSQPFDALARDDRLLGAVARALGGRPQLMKDKFIAKPPGASGYAAHQDGAYWPGMGFDVSRFLTAVIFLDDATAENGAIECVAGYHRQMLTDPDVIADLDEASLDAFTTVEARAGDLLLLHALTPHRSGPNRSARMRRALLFTYGVDERPNLYALYKQFQQDIRR